MSFQVSEVSSLEEGWNRGFSLYDKVIDITKSKVKCKFNGFKNMLISRAAMDLNGCMYKSNLPKVPH